MHSSKPFAGKIALVTGAGSGIGQAIAERLAADGAQVVLNDINEERGAAVAARIDGYFIGGDLAGRANCQRLMQATLARYGTVHILVNNAGYQHIDSVADFPEDTWEDMIAVMLTAPFLLTRYAWPALQAQGWGRIINVASIHGMVASPYKSAYVSAKHGLIGLTRTTALEGGAHGITVNAICPAYVRTPLVENQIRDQARTRNLSEAEVIQNVMLEPAAIKRLIEPAEVAALAAFLCSPEAGVITGTQQVIDLGWTAR